MEIEIKKHYEIDNLHGLIIDENDDFYIINLNKLASALFKYTIVDNKLRQRSGWFHADYETKKINEEDRYKYLHLII